MRDFRRRILGTAAISSIIAAGSTAARAQEPIDEIIVTGTRIPLATNAASASPVTTIENVEFDIRGTTRVEDLINSLPQAFADQGANVSNGATGTATLNLRGLGSTRTLVLIDGRRLQYGSAISSPPDINQIPGALVERVDVLTGGASAVYGSDAIAGVVNFIMVKDFEGVRLDGQLSAYQHSNDNAFAQERLAARGFSSPEKGVLDGKGQDATLIIGANTEDGRGNVTAYAGYRHNDAVIQADRDYSACAFQTFGAPPGAPGGVICGGSFVGQIGTFFVPSTGPSGGFAPGTYTLDSVSGNQFISGVDLFNFAPTNFYQRPDERYTLGAFAHYEINAQFDTYMQAMFYDYTSDAQIAFSGNFFNTNTINCDNPFLSNTPGPMGFSQLDAICGDVDIGPDGNYFTFGPDGMPGTADDTPGFDDFIIPGSGSTIGTGNVYVGRRLAEGRPRNDHIRLTSFRIVGGVRGEVMEGWSYDAFFQYANTHNAQQYENDVSVMRLIQAMDVIDADPGPGVTPVCRDPSNGCVPFNPWEIGQVTPAAAAFLSVPSQQDGNTWQYLGQITLTGDLGVYGITLPWADKGIGVSGGFEWRKDKLVYTPDALFFSGDLAGGTSEIPAVNGAIETTDFFVETAFPLASGRTLVESLTLTGGYRHSDVSATGPNSSWKLLGDWQITPDLRVRGGWQRAVRAANVIEAFTPQAAGITGLGTAGDPCAGSMPAASLAACMNTGVTAGQYGSIADTPIGNYNAIFGGSATLDAEKSDTYTAGVVLTPGEYVPGNFFISVDYFNITLNGAIGTLFADEAMDNCLATGDPFFCDLIVRGPAGTLWRGNDPGFLLTNLNIGALKTAGVDINANASFDFVDLGLGDAGGLEFDFVATYLFELSFELLPGAAPFDCAGLYGGGCGPPSPVWRHKLRTTWETPIGVDATVTWRMFSGVDRDGAVVIDPAMIRDRLHVRHYIDVAASYDLTDKWNIRVGCNNLLDKDPPLTAPGANGNTNPQVYDALGRYLFVGATIDF